MTTPKKFVFVLMPFEESFNDIYTYGIKQTCVELGTYCERVDEQIFHERILDRIYNQIAKADIIVADMSNRNPNVFYEVGYAHGLGKSVILLTQKSDDIPFDLKHFPHIIYNAQIKKLSAELKTRVEWFLNNDTIKEATNYDFSLEFMINGCKIENGTDINISRNSPVDLKIDIYNASPKVYKSEFKLGMETAASSDDLISGLEKIRPSRDLVLFMFPEISSIYPNGYTSVPFRLNRPVSKDGEPITVETKLKIFTALEVKEIEFTLTIHPYRPMVF